MTSPRPDIQPIRFLIGGFINSNSIEGSAFFLTSLVSMLSKYPFVSITLLLANRIERIEVLEEILSLPNVTIIDPFNSSQIKLADSQASSNSLSRIDYAKTLLKVENSTNFDLMIVRDTEVCSMLISQQPNVAKKLLSYITGVSHHKMKLSHKLRQQIALLEASDSTLLVQTPEMKSELIFAGLIPSNSSVEILPPHVPDPIEPPSYGVSERTAPLGLVYTGKLYKDWNVDQLISAFKSVNSDLKDSLTLEIAGDHFQNSIVDPLFKENTSYLLASTPSLVWHRGVSRNEARAIISRNSIGISWRSPTLDSSLELSTKILEYGSLGVPSILNRTPMHERLLGTDYPMFANSMTEFKDLLRSLPHSQKEIAIATERSFHLSEKYSYSAVAEDFFKMILRIYWHNHADYIYISDLKPQLNTIDQQRVVEAESLGPFLRFKNSPVGKTTLAEATNFHLVSHEFWGKALSTSTKHASQFPLRAPQQRLPILNSRSVFDEVEFLRKESSAIKRELNMHRTRTQKLRNLNDRFEKSKLRKPFGIAKRLALRLIKF